MVKLYHITVGCLDLFGSCGVADCEDAVVVFLFWHFAVLAGRCWHMVVVVVIVVVRCRGEATHTE